MWVRLRRAWRGAREILAFLRAGALAILEVITGHGPESAETRERRGRAMKVAVARP